MFNASKNSNRSDIYVNLNNYITETVTSYHAGMIKSILHVHEINDCSCEQLPRFLAPVSQKKI